MINNQEANKRSVAKDHYMVAVKLLLRDGDTLLITKDQWGEWDLPGGRIRTDQFNVPLEDILEDKVVEELGSDLKYELGEIKTTFRVERKEAGRGGETVRIFAVGYEAKYLSGEIKLGDHHEKYEWINLKTADLNDYASPSGWITQLTDRL